MKLHFILLSAALIFTSCAPQKKALPFLPPGKEMGETWNEASSFGYEEPVYTLPEYIAYSLEGNQELLKQTQKTYQQDICRDGDAKVILRMVINAEGEISGLHPLGKINPNCLKQLQISLERFTFYPAEHESKNVSMLYAITLNDRRL